MNIFISGILTKDINSLLDTPALSEARKYWTKKDYFEKSSIDLRVFQTEFATISILYGPRQIGKTSALRQYLTTVKDSETIIFLDCSVILDRKDLYEHLKSSIKGQTTIVLDEVQEVDEWYLALRALHGEGSLQSCRIWCTGSEARYLLESGERLPGRKGKGKIVFARPWSFREYMDMFYPELIQPLKNINIKHVNQRWLEDQKISLSDKWNQYVLTGGIPKVIGEFLNNKQINDETYRIYEDWVMGSWSHIRTPERSLRNLSKRICENINTRTSYDALKKSTDIQSSNTVKSLLEMQEDHFSIRTLTRFNLETHSFSPAKLKKFYPLDPFVGKIYWAIGNRVTRLYEKEIKFNKLSETAFFAQTLKYNYDDEIGFIYNDKTQAEIDFYFNECAFELKTNGKPNKKQFELLKRAPQAFIVRQEHLPIIAYLVGESREKGDSPHIVPSTH